MNKFKFFKEDEPDYKNKIYLVKCEVRSNSTNIDSEYRSLNISSSYYSDTFSSKSMAIKAGKKWLNMIFHKIYDKHYKHEYESFSEFKKHEIDVSYGYSFSETLDINGRFDILEYNQKLKDDYDNYFRDYESIDFNHRKNMFLLPKAIMYSYTIAGNPYGTIYLFNNNDQAFHSPLDNSLSAGKKFKNGDIVTSYCDGHKQLFVISAGEYLNDVLTEKKRTHTGKILFRLILYIMTIMYGIMIYGRNQI